MLAGDFYRNRKAFPRLGVDAAFARASPMKNARRRADAEAPSEMEVHRVVYVDGIHDTSPRSPSVT